MKKNSMAVNLSTTASSLHPKPAFPVRKHNSLLKFYPLSSSSSSIRTSAQSEGTETGVTEDDASSGSLSSARTQLDLLEQLTSTSSSINGYESDGSSLRPSIREQLAQLVGDRDDDFSIPLGKNLKKVSAKFLTISQKRNIRRQAYLNEVSQRNDSVFFATIGAFVLLPPLIILGIAVLTGYVQLFP
ncbi:putative transmembrane protein [Senna tora]|uniref:Putative transmembrane protein n=1 Tax=Senna tora TaxID=362788 RepID=A0A834T564_9FABA|nr:putative transmembrane protein [Senna tora]